MDLAAVLPEVPAMPQVPTMAPVVSGQQTEAQAQEQQEEEEEEPVRRRALGDGHQKSKDSAPAKMLLRLRHRASWLLDRTWPEHAREASRAAFWLATHQLWEDPPSSPVPAKGRISRARGIGLDSNPF